MRRTNQNIWRRQIYSWLLIAAVGMGSLQTVTVQADEAGDTAMGRYTESEIMLPEEAQVQDIVRMADGRLRIVGMSMDTSEAGSWKLWDSTDGGKTWEEAAKLPEEYNDGEFFFSMALSRDGGGAGIRMVESDSDDTLEDWDEELLVFDADGQAQCFPLEEPNVSQLSFTESNALVAQISGGEAVLLDPESGKTVCELVASSAQIVGTWKDQALVLSTDSLQIYDTATHQPGEGQEALEEALFAENTSYMMTGTTARSILFAQSEDGRIFYATRKGIYSYAENGSVVEEIVNGNLCFLSDPGMQLVALEESDAEFYVVCAKETGENTLVKLSYDPDVAATPQQELTVYSLEEDAGMRRLIARFQKQNPDIYVNYQIGLSGEDGVTASDALRMLNTEILAGDGPDVLMLDGISVDTYTEKGLLMDLTTVLANIQEQDGVLAQIAETYRQEDGSIPAVPCKFYIPAICGDPEILDVIDGLASLEQLAAQEGVFTSDGMLMLPERLYPLLVGTWSREDGTLDAEALQEYIQTVQQVWKTYEENASEKVRENIVGWEESEDSILAQLPDYGAALSGSSFDLLGGNAKAEIGVLTGMYDYAELTSVNRQTPCEVRQANLGAEDVFVPYETLGVLSNAKAPEAAETFVCYALSEEGQMADVETAFPVNETALNRVVSEPFFRDGEFSMASSNQETGEAITLICYWPGKDQQEELLAMAGRLSTRVDLNRIPRQTVLEETRKCMKGEESADEAVNAIMQKINLYLAE
ncbi:MAG: extracellular solute-binding protein [Lachnospiraceae bacterium]|nr:extracellular solute-binding protein [Lachnospiraceae bacterium]